MKKLSSVIILLFCAFISFAQTFPNNTSQSNASTKTNILGALTSLGYQPKYFTDTASANVVPYLKSTPNIMIVVGDDIYIRNRLFTKWILVSANSTTIYNYIDSSIRNYNTVNGIDSSTILLDGSAAIDSGFMGRTTFLRYKILGRYYTANSMTFTLPSSSISADKYAVVYADTLGNVGVISGVAGNPAKIPVDAVNPRSQIIIAIYSIKAGSLTPEGVDNIPIYRENIEWATSSSTGVLFNYTGLAPYSGLVSTFIPTGSTTRSFTYNGGTLYDLKQLSFLKFRIKLSASLNPNTYLNITYYNGTQFATSYIPLTNGSYGFNYSIVGSWQFVVIPVTEWLPLTSDTKINKLEFYLQGAANAFQMDDIFLQKGGGNISNTGVITFNGQSGHVTYRAADSANTNGDTTLYQFYDKASGTRLFTLPTYVQYLSTDTCFTLDTVGRKVNIRFNANCKGTGGGGGIDSTTASNGLNLVGKTVKLGGLLTEDVLIIGNGNYSLDATSLISSTFTTYNEDLGSKYAQGRLQVAPYQIQIKTDSKDASVNNVSAASISSLSDGLSSTIRINIDSAVGVSAVNKSYVEITKSKIEFFNSGLTAKYPTTYLGGLTVRTLPISVNGTYAGTDGNITIAGGGTTDTTSLSNRINLKLNISDTAAMLSPYKTSYPRQSISLTTGGSGAATYNNSTGVFNVPTPAGGGGAGVTKAQAPFVIKGGDTISRRWNVLDYLPGFVSGVTDATTGIQAAINACDAGGGGTVFFPNGTYIIGGALQTNIGGLNMNSQLYIPTHEYTDTLRSHIILMGETPPNFTQISSLANFPQSKVGVILKSTLTTGSYRASVIGTKGNAGGFGSLNYNFLTVENIMIVVKNNPSGSGPVVGGINYAYGASLQTNKVVVTIDTSANFSTLPYNDIAGIETPNNGSETMSNIQNTLVGGLKSGYIIGEHVVLNQVQAFVCYYGFNFKQGYHATSSLRTGSYWNAYDIYVSGVITLSNFQLDTEWKQSGKWFDAVATIKDTANLSTGHVFYTIILAGTGKSNGLFSKIGGTYLHTSSNDQGVLPGTTVIPPPSQWTTTGSDIYYNTGSASIGSIPVLGEKLHIESNGNAVQQHLVLKNSSNGPGAQVHLDLHNDVGTGFNGGAALFYTSSTYGAPYASALGFWNYQNGPIILSTNATPRLWVHSGGGIQMTNYTAGTATFDGSGNITSSSDRRIKNSINDFKYGLAAILKLKPSTFIYNADSSKTVMSGFIAQDVQQVIPGAVHKAKDKIGTLSLETNAIIAALVNGMKEQQTQLEQLKKEIEKLKLK